MVIWNPDMMRRRRPWPGQSQQPGPGEGPPQWWDPYGGQEALQNFFSGDYGTEGLRAIREATERSVQDFSRNTGSRAGSLASAFATQRARQSGGADAANFRRQQEEARLGARVELMSPKQEQPEYGSDRGGGDGYPPQDWEWPWERKRREPDIRWATRKQPGGRVG